MKCPKCGLNNYGDVDRCFNCGTSLVQTVAQYPQSLPQQPQQSQNQQQPYYQSPSPQHAPQTTTQIQSHFQQQAPPQPRKKLKKGIIAAIIIVIVVVIIVIASLSIIFSGLYSDTGDVDITVTNKYYSFVSGGIVVLNITFENNKNYPIRFYTGDFSVRLKNGTICDMSTIIGEWPDRVEPGDIIEFEIGFKRSEIGSIENMDKLIYDHEEQWGTIHHIYKEVDI